MHHHAVSQDAFLWALQALCTLHRKPYSAELAQQQHVAPYDPTALTTALDGYGFDASLRKLSIDKLHRQSFPLIVWLRPKSSNGSTTQGGATTTVATPEPADIATAIPALILQADTSNALLLRPGDAAPITVPLERLARRCLGHVITATPQSDAANDPDSASAVTDNRPFGYRWFVPELLKHKRLWQEILLASLVIQLIALATPLFTQTIIDKVVVHHTQSTLIVIALGMAVFMLFSAGLSWLRQYLILHTGNRIDAVLGSAVFERLFKLPPMYFQHRPTGVIAARLQGIDTIREFLAGAAVTLILDLPFLLIFVAIMLYYSVTLTLIVVAVLAVIIGLSILTAPLFQTRLQQQFQLGARNQAFITEYLVGMDTVKSLQLEPQLNRKYSGYLASYLQAGFATRQLANTYNTSANLLEQVMTLLILAIGAWTVMHDTAFTIGMLVAFQMFSGRLSQPLLRLVGLWQQFQQANLSIARLGDLMNAPTEPYAVVPRRDNARQGHIRIDRIAFRYQETHPLVYDNLSLEIPPGHTIALMGASGCGKSTLAKLLQGFYQPSNGRIELDGIDIRHLSANELRSHFGVVPQETVLFSGTIYDNLHMASPNASFEQIVAACQMAEIHDAIEALPQGYQTDIGERGAGLSGGQKQRIAIARALLKRPSILVFDEATSALDQHTAEQFAHTINSLKGKVTMIFITHSLPKGLQVDAIYRLNRNGAQRLFPALIAGTGMSATTPSMVA